MSVATYKSLFPQIEEFANEIEEVLNMRLYSNHVLVVWKWRCDPLAPEEAYEEPWIIGETDDEDNGEESQTVESSCSDVRLYTVVFKCIGATRDQKWQSSLRAARDKQDKGETIPVRLQPEPNNIRDPKAIAFECLLEGKWARIGYIVRELLDEVHESIDKKVIVNVEFDWIKYMTNWTFSGPGYYAGIALTKKGPWSNKAISSSSASPR